MEKETYKKAKEILERFDPEKHKKLEVKNVVGVFVGNLHGYCLSPEIFHPLDKFPIFS